MDKVLFASPKVKEKQETFKENGCVFALTIEVFLLALCLFYLRWGEQ